MPDLRYRIDQPIPVGTRVLLTNVGETDLLLGDRIGTPVYAKVLPIGDTTFHGYVPVVIDTDNAADPGLRGREIPLQWRVDELVLATDIPTNTILSNTDRLGDWLDA